ncbi:5-(carboxyamino)imidazole ribonucleotide mutase [Selenomonadales bacterium OttesenSCG-928-I06]|nr:5-(carboxyamino)imidazole ribonucleotide mutase [Selenomonadales bacterium OttesenSCG-928-I06]
MKVAVIMGSDSDYPVLEPLIKTLEEFGIESEILVASAHRTPEKVHVFASSAKQRGIKIIIAAAGAAAHLAGVIASVTTLPVIGIPIKSSALNGMDSLLSTVQMPAGIPVATMAIDGAKNAALFAIQILALSDNNLADKLETYRDNLKIEVEQKNANLQKKLNK